MNSVISREEAKSQNKTSYYTGELCSNGHDSERITSSGKCRRCHNDTINRYRKNKLLSKDDTFKRKTILNTSRLRAVSKGVPFDLTLENVTWNTHCPVFDCELEYFSDIPLATSASVDRLKPELGYVHGNVRIISHRANTIKNNGTIEDFEKLVTYLENPWKDRQIRASYLPGSVAYLKRGSIFSAAWKRAKKNKLPFDIWHKDIVLPDKCPVLGFDLVYDREETTYDSPTLDRLDCTKGYVKGNVRIISHKANRLKNDATLKEVRKVLSYMKRESVEDR